MISILLVWTINIFVVVEISALLNLNYGNAILSWGYLKCIIVSLRPMPFTDIFRRINFTHVVMVAILARLYVQKVSACVLS